MPAVQFDSWFSFESRFPYCVNEGVFMSKHTIWALVWAGLSGGYMMAAKPYGRRPDGGDIIEMVLIVLAPLGISLIVFIAQGHKAATQAGHKNFQRAIHQQNDRPAPSTDQAPTGQLLDFVTLLEAYPYSNKGFVLAGATDIRNEYIDQGYPDPINPKAAMAERPDFVEKLFKRIEILQMQNTITGEDRFLSEISWVMVWVFTLSSINDRTQQVLVGRLWKALMEGREFVQDAARDHREFTLRSLDITNYSMIPKGMPF